MDIIRIDNRKSKTICLKGAKLLSGKWKNFSGSQFGKGGKRQVAVRLTPEDAEYLSSEGWTVKVKDYEDGQSDPVYRLEITIDDRNLEDGNPDIQIQKDNGTRYRYRKKSQVDELDNLPISAVNCTIRMYNSQDSRTGQEYHTAYLNSMLIYPFESYDPTFGDNPEEPMDYTN